MKHISILVAIALCVGASSANAQEKVNLPTVQEVAGTVEVSNLPAVQDVRIVSGTLELDQRTLAVNVIDEEMIAGFTTETRFVDVSGHSILRFVVTRASVEERMEISVLFSLGNTPDAFVRVLNPGSLSKTVTLLQVDVFGPTARIEVSNRSDSAASPLSLSVYGVR